MNSINIDFSKILNDIAFIFDIETLTQISININDESNLDDVDNVLFFQRMHNSPNIRHIIINMCQYNIPSYDLIHKFLNQNIDTIEINYMNGYNFKDSNFFALMEAIQTFPNITGFNLKCIHNYYSFHGEKFTEGKIDTVPDIVVNKNNLYDFFQKYDINFNHDRCLNVVNEINRIYKSLDKCRDMITISINPKGWIRTNKNTDRVTLSNVRSFFNENEMDKLCDILSQTNLNIFSINLCMKKNSRYRFYDLFSEQQQNRINDCMIHTHIKSAKNI